MTIYDTFTSNPDCVQLVGTDFELFHPIHGDCDRHGACPSCKFRDAQSCCVSPMRPEFQPIYDFFKLNHPDKFI